jgi:hypothetical protein
VATTSRHHGPDKRVVGVALCAVVAVLVVLGAWLVSAITGAALQWGVLLPALMLVVMSFAAFLVIRFTR